MGKKPWLLLTAVVWFVAAFAGCQTTPSTKDNKDAKFTPSPTFSRNDPSKQQSPDATWSPQPKTTADTKSLDKTQGPASPSTTGPALPATTLDAKPAATNPPAPVSLGPTDPSAMPANSDKAPEALKVVKPPPPALTVTQTNRPVDSEIHIVPSQQPMRGDDLNSPTPAPPVPVTVQPTGELNLTPLPSLSGPSQTASIPSFGPPPVSLKPDAGPAAPVPAMGTTK